VGSADISLRHIARRWAADLARGLIPHDEPLEVLGWLDTQVTAAERRLDKAMLLRVAAERRALHIEFEVDPGAELPERVYEYQALLFLALRADTSRPVPPIKSVIVVLRGRREPHPEQGEHRISWLRDDFSGARFRIEAVYQLTVAELRARAGLVWLVFTPLARDATAEAMRSVLAEIRAAVPRPDERTDIYSAMGALADLKPWGYSLRKEIREIMKLTDDAVFRESVILQEAFAEGRAEGIQEGEAKGIAETVERTLRSLFLRRSGRAPTPAEQEALARRAHETTPEQIADITELPGDALVTWLLGK
jgi:predicted transposase YdaD